MSHICNYYCTPPVHAYKLLTHPAITEGRIRAQYLLQGKQVERIVPAREADVDQWRTECTRGWQEGDLRVVEVPEALRTASVPWLVFLRHGEERT